MDDSCWVEICCDPSTYPIAKHALFYLFGRYCDFFFDYDLKGRTPEIARWCVLLGVLNYMFVSYFFGLHRQVKGECNSSCLLVCSP